MHPLDASIADCRRPSVEASYGQRIYNPANVSQGERYYNPFPFDVGCLGNLYLNWLNSAIPVVPLLAPFLGKTTTHVVRDRFTAEEALAFLTEIRAPPYQANEHYKSYFWHSPANTGDSETRNLPYAICTDKCDSPSAVMDSKGCRRVACAQDAMHRDIVVKVIITGSMEHQIYQRIHEVPAELFTDSSTFPCVLPPTALLDSQRGYTLKVTTLLTQSYTLPFT
ncbi:hypothetical protein C2E23DRAFT_30946 [Lenzites betulinus]|nr:hypothetical protein C2E23DRAFT_30946 [Lenzites betulinus]